MMFQGLKDAKIAFPEDADYVNFYICVPVPVPVKDEWNIALKDSNSECFSHLFFYPQTGEKAYLFKRSIKCKWSELAQRIKSILVEEGLGRFGISAMIKSFGDEDLNLKPINSYFSSDEALSKARNIMIVICSSFEDITVSYLNKSFSTKSVPRIPKDLIYRCHNAALEFGYSSNIRRLIRVCINGCIPVNIFENFLELDTFSKVVLHYGPNTIIMIMNGYSNSSACLF